MMKSLPGPRSLFPALVLCAALAASAAAEKNLAVFAPDFAGAAEFRKFIELNGGAVVTAFPPAVFICEVPSPLEAEVKRKFGGELRRGPVRDPGRFRAYGDAPFAAVGLWNRRFDSFVPEAPVPDGASGPRPGGAVRLVWADSPGATGYRLQVGSDAAFAAPLLDLGLKDTSYEFHTAFLAAGTWHWRVSASAALDGGKTSAGEWSGPASFAVVQPVRSPGAPVPQKVSLRPASSLKGLGRLQWDPAPGANYYRLQVSADGDFSRPLADVFTSAPSYKLARTSLPHGRTYFIRVMSGADGAAGPWSDVSRLTLESPPPLINDVRPPARKK